MINLRACNKEIFVLVEYTTSGFSIRFRFIMARPFCSFFYCLYYIKKAVTKIVTA